MNVSNGRNEPLDEHAAGHRMWLGALTVLVAMVATVALALYQFVPPAVVPADAPAKEFSAERAMTHLEVIARKPHPVGSPANARVASLRWPLPARTNALRQSSPTTSWTRACPSPSVSYAFPPG